ncbi:TonB-dependent receptor [Pseudomaricurvus alkylphenolicus]|uniref:TonB-dependent receptor n=1 Tax=Pseudomaricurvus alkylphenolicus TaxID=1306991 RepID=UPI00141F6AF7|nr:TonB-dependent receptor [Pseudomaricurvus alkylphenolicus]NIB43513.1 TonB-dependent receptor [Pseudomaricurvus alkylphenolicus]
MKIPSNLNLGIFLLPVATSIAWPLTTIADGGLLEEVIVTAQKREESIQDVGVAVTAFNGDALRSLGWSNSEDVAAQTPGLVATSFSGDSSVSLFSLRGVGQNDFADHQEAPTAVYVDGVYVAATGAAGVQMFDTERVEVLKGPQGTLFGRNATGGLIHIVSRQPTDEFEGYLDATIGSYGQIRLEGVVSGAISENVYGRLSVVNEEADGYFRNTIGDDIREKDFTNVRAQVDYKPTDNTSVDLTLWSAVTDDVTGGAYDMRPSVSAIGDVPFDWSGNPDNSKPNEGAVSIVGHLDKEAYGTDLTIVSEFDTFTFSSITSYSDLKKSFLESDPVPNPAYTYATTQDASQFSQEIRFNGETDRTRWQAGLYYLYLDGDYSGDDQLNTFGGATINNFSLKTKSWSLFGQGEYDLTERLTFILGLRVVTDEKEFSLNSTCQPVDALEVGEIEPTFGLANDCSIFTSGDPENPLVLDVVGDTHLDMKDTEVAANIKLNYNLGEDVLLFAGVSRGVKAGGFTAPVDGFLTPGELAYKPEILMSYEVGVKSTLADGRARLNATAFYYDYDDYQAFLFQGTTAAVINRDAQIAGAEVELIANPADGWEVSLGLSILDATVDGEAAGDQDMITAPDLTANFLVSKEWQLDNDSLKFQVDGYYVDEQQYNSLNNAPFTVGDSYTLWNARLSYIRDQGDWEVSLFAKNLTDEENVVYQFDMTTFTGTTYLVYGPPRWLGAQVRYNW